MIYFLNVFSNFVLYLRTYMSINLSQVTIILNKTAKI